MSDQSSDSNKRREVVRKDVFNAVAFFRFSYRIVLPAFIICLVIGWYAGVVVAFAFATVMFTGLFMFIQRILALFVTVEPHSSRRNAQQRPQDPKQE